MVTNGWALTVRAVDRYGRTGYNSPWLPPSAVAGWSTTTYFLTGGNLSAYLNAAKNVIVQKAPGCLRDTAIKKSFDVLSKSAYRSGQLYVVAPTVLANYYSHLFTTFNTSSCEEMKKLVAYSAQMGVSALAAPRTAPVALTVETTWTQPASWLPHYCFVKLSSYGGGAIPHPSDIAYNKFLNQASCAQQAKNWF